MLGRATSKSRASFFRLLARQAPLTPTADTNDRAVNQTAHPMESVMNNLNWEQEHKRFMDVAYARTHEGSEASVQRLAHF